MPTNPRSTPDPVRSAQKAYDDQTAAAEAAHAQRQRDDAKATAERDADRQAFEARYKKNPGPPPTIESGFTKGGAGGSAAGGGQ